MPIAVGHLLSGGLLAGSLNTGRRVSAGGTGLVVLTDPVLDRVVLFDVNGDRPRKLVAFGDPGDKPGQLTSPHGAGLNAFRELFVVDSLNHRIQVFDLSPVALGHQPRLVRFWGARGNGLGELDTPEYGVAFPNRSEPRHLVYVADTGNHRIAVFDRFGTPTGLLIGQGSGDGRLDRPGGLAFDPTGAVLYVVDRGRRRVAAFDSKTGQVLFSFGHAGSGEGALIAPESVALDSTGTVFVSDPGSRRVLRFRPEAEDRGTVRRMRYEGAWAFIGDTEGTWTHPQGIAVDGKDRVWVADMAGGRCQAFSREGAFVAALDDDLELSRLGSLQGSVSSTLADSICTNGGTYALRLRSSPTPVSFNRPFEMEVEVLEGCSGSQPAEGLTLSVDAVRPEQGQGMNTEPLVQTLGKGRFRVFGMLLHTAGLWEIHLDLTRDRVTERAQVTVVLQ